MKMKIQVKQTADLKILSFILLVTFYVLKFFIAIFWKMQLNQKNLIISQSTNPTWDNTPTQCGRGCLYNLEGYVDIFIFERSLQ